MEIQMIEKQGIDQLKNWILHPEPLSIWCAQGEMGTFRLIYKENGIPRLWRRCRSHFHIRAFLFCTVFPLLKGVFFNLWRFLRQTNPKKMCVVLFWETLLSYRIDQTNVCTMLLSFNPCWLYGNTLMSHMSQQLLKQKRRRCWRCPAESEA